MCACRGCFLSSNPVPLNHVSSCGMCFEECSRLLQQQQEEKLSEKIDVKFSLTSWPTPSTAACTSQLNPLLRNAFYVVAIPGDLLRQRGSGAAAGAACVQRSRFSSRCGSTLAGSRSADSEATAVSSRVADVNCQHLQLEVCEKQYRRTT